nr:MAG TPA: PGRP protein [Caudoviricetes sp.]
MNLHELYLTENDCYKANRKMAVKGIMVHSTGVNNPYLCRYVGPNDGLLGENKYQNHWNQPTPGGRQVCVHAFIGKLADGTVATYQTLPWDICGWHSGSGSKGNANFLGYIGFEICEDALDNADYFQKVYTEAVELCAYLCKEFSLTPGSILCHSEGHTKGIASDHADVMHWFPRFGKSMDTFRSDVRVELQKQTPPPKDNTPAEWAKDAVNWALETSLLKGDQAGNLLLHSPLTREQFCVMLKRYHDMTQK